MNAAGTCSRCGTAVPPGARACPSCGADVTGQQGQVATEWVDAATLSQASLRDTLARATLGEYEVQRELGQGGMASVFLAHEIALDRKVALKVMAPSIAAMPGMVERFKREARTAAALSHPHIIPIYAVKESGGLVYFAMKYIEGRSLESVIARTGPLPIPIVQAIIYQVGQALGHANRRGVVHRDVKPANIMLDPDGWAVVTDFGIAKVAEARGLTQTGATIGTPSYMSPEQCAAKRELTGASDQYSLGVVVFEMLTGRLPFSAETTVGLLYAHVHEPPPPVTDLRPDCPAEVADALMRMLAKEPEERWPDVESAVAALGGTPVGHDDPIRAQLVELAGGRGATPAMTVHTPVSPLPANRAKAAAPPPTNVTSAKDRRPATRTAPRPAAPPTAPPPRRVAPAVWAVPLVLAAGAGAWWALGRHGGAGAQTPGGSATPETVVVVQRPPAETVKLAGAPPSPGVQSSPTATTAAPGTGATSTAQPAPAASPGSLNPAAEARALARRLRAVTAGATSQELATGDAEAQAAERLARSGRPEEARRRLQAAIVSWDLAADAARLRPRTRTTAPANPEVEISRTVEEFAAAFSSKSLPRIRQVFPGMTMQQTNDWAALFLKARNLQARLSVANLTVPGGGRAEGTVRGDYSYQDLNSGAGARQEVSWHAVFVEAPSGWKIESLQ